MVGFFFGGVWFLQSKAAGILPVHGVNPAVFGKEFCWMIFVWQFLPISDGSKPLKQSRTIGLCLLGWKNLPNPQNMQRKCNVKVFFLRCTGSSLSAQGKDEGAAGRSF